MIPVEFVNYMMLALPASLAVGLVVFYFFGKIPLSRTMTILLGFGIGWLVALGFYYMRHFAGFTF